MNLKYIRQISSDREYFGDSEIPTHAVIEIDRKLLAWIRKAKRAVKDLKASGVEQFDYTPDLKISEDGTDDTSENTLKDADDFRVDYMILHVSDDRIHWDICEKHSGIMFSTEGIYFSEINENLKVLRAKPTLLPLMLDHLKNETSKLLLNERLRTK
jgi:hypothetical protein